MNNITGTKGRMRLAENVSYQLRDKNGNIKPLFAVNKLGKAIIEKARKGYNVYNSNGSLKKGIRANLALHGIRLPFITGSWQKELSISNLVTNAGFAGVASRINGSGAEAAFTYIGLGTGTTAANVADTTLETEIVASGGERASATASRTTSDVTDDTATLVHTFSFTGSLAITESGVLNAASVGVLLCRQVFSVINVANGDSLQVTWDVDVD